MALDSLKNSLYISAFTFKDALQAHPLNSEMKKGEKSGSVRRYNKSQLPRLRWTPELHQHFVDAVQHLGGKYSKFNELIFDGSILIKKENKTKQKRFLNRSIFISKN